MTITSPPILLRAGFDGFPHLSAVTLGLFLKHISADSFTLIMKSIVFIFLRIYQLSSEPHGFLPRPFYKLCSHCKCHSGHLSTGEWVSSQQFAALPWAVNVRRGFYLSAPSCHGYDALDLADGKIPTVSLTP